MTLSGRGWVGPHRFSKFPLSDHGVLAKIVQTPPRSYTLFLVVSCHQISGMWIANKRQSVWIALPAVTRMLLGPLTASCVFRCSIRMRVERRTATSVSRYVFLNLTNYTVWSVVTGSNKQLATHSLGHTFTHPNIHTFKVLKIHSAGIKKICIWRPSKASAEAPRWFLYISGDPPMSSEVQRNYCMGLRPPAIRRSIN